MANPTYVEAIHGLRELITLRAFLKSHRQDRLVLLQIFKFLFFMVMFYRRWRGPGHSLPLSGAASQRYIMRSEELSKEIPEHLRGLYEGRASVMENILMNNIMTLRDSLSKEGRRIFDSLPIVDVIASTVDSTVVPVPMQRSTFEYHPGGGEEQHFFHTVYKVLELTGHGHSCVRETSHLLSRSAVFYFLCLTGTPLIPLRLLETVTPVV